MLKRMVLLEGGTWTTWLHKETDKQSYNNGACPLYGISGGLGHLLWTSATTQLGKTSLTSSLKIPNSFFHSR